MRKELERILESNKKDLTSKRIFIWGAGDTTQLLDEGLKRLDWDIEGICDKNPAKVGSHFCGKVVIHPDNLPTENTTVLVCSRQPRILREILAELKQRKIDGANIDAVILGNNSDEVLRCYDLLNDDRSREVFSEIVISRIEGRNPGSAYIDENEYYGVPGLNINENTVFVDCGAWIGDQEEEFVKRSKGVFGSIIAYELDKGNYTRLVNNVNELFRKNGIDIAKADLRNCGVGDKNLSIFYENFSINDGEGCKIIDETRTVHSEMFENKMVALDEENISRCDFLKADIESFEYKMIVGAKKLIRNNKPFMAVCIYHNSVDIYTIPILIKSLVNEYKIDIRHHFTDQTATIVYAWL